jgi:Helix-turn-helix domain
VEHHPDDLYTTEEVAERYRKDPGTVRYWRHKGTGPKGTLFGRRVLYRWSDLLAWEKQIEDADQIRRSA